mgnify:CR=1 FL=1
MLLKLQLYRNSVKAGIILGFIVFIVGCENTTPKQYPFTYADGIMGTSFSIKASQLPENITVKALQTQIKKRLDEINQRMSTYVADSELVLLNQSRSTVAQKISKPLFKVLAAAEKISQKTAGAFDITVAPLVDLWGFGADGHQSIAPKAANIKLLLLKNGYQKLRLDEKNLTLTKEFPTIAMDLSALAKGYAVDEIALILENNNIHDYLVEIGGEIRLKGYNIQGKKWRIAIEKPNIHQRELQKVIPITDIAMATSGDYRNFFEQDGQQFSHTIDPRTGYPVQHKLSSVTVLSDRSMKADAWATAFMVLGDDAGYKIAEENNLAVLFIIKTEQGFAERATPLFIELTEVEK